MVRSCVRSALGVEVERLDALPSELSTRAFFRVHLASGSPATVIARIEASEDTEGRPAGAGPEPALPAILELLGRAGLPVPKRYGGDPERGVDLLEDVGDLSLDRAVTGAAPETRRDLYRRACALVPRIQRVCDPGGVPAFGRHLDRRLIAYKAELFASWSLPAALGRKARPSEREAVREGFDHVAEVAARAPARLAHRDLQSRNIHVRGGPAGELRLLDVQGAFLAPPEYDLVCLLRDSYVELPPEEVSDLLAEVRPALPDAPDPEAFARRFDLLTLARKGKDHARFVYAWRKRRDARYLAALPPTMRALHTAASGAIGREPRVAALCELLLDLPEVATCAH